MSCIENLIRLGLLHAGGSTSGRAVRLDELNDEDRMWVAWFAALPAPHKQTVEAWARKGIKVTPDILADILAIDADRKRLTAEWRARACGYRRSP